MPVPEPTAEYLTGMPSLISKLLIQLAISGATSVEPAPVTAAEAAAAVTEAMIPTDATTAISRRSNLVRCNADSFPVDCRRKPPQKGSQRCVNSVKDGSNN